MYNFREADGSVNDDNARRSSRKTQQQLFELCHVKVDFSATEHIRSRANKKAKKVSETCHSFHVQVQAVADFDPGCKAGSDEQVGRWER